MLEGMGASSDMCQAYKTIISQCWSQHFPVTDCGAHENNRYAEILAETYYTIQTSESNMTNH